MSASRDVSHTSLEPLSLSSLEEPTLGMKRRGLLLV